MIHCNCIHFADEFAKFLNVEPVPPWVKGLHEAGAQAGSLFRLWPAPQETATAGTAHDTREEAGDTSGVIDDIAAPSDFMLASEALCAVPLAEFRGCPQPLQPSFMPAPSDEV